MLNSTEYFLKPNKILKPVPTHMQSNGIELTGIKAFIFDIYGTMLISASGDLGSAVESGTTEAFKHCIKSCGLTAQDESVYPLIRKLYFSLIKQTHSKLKDIGFPNPEVDIVSIWSEILNTPAVIDLIPECTELSPRIAAASYESFVNPVYPMPGIFELCSHPIFRKSYLGIISNAQFYTPLLFDYLTEGGLEGLGFCPDLCIYSYKERRAKPDTFLFKIMTKKLHSLGISPSEAVFIGNDLLNDIMPAAVSGYKTILFAGDRRSLKLRKNVDACKNIKPDVIVSNLTDIIDFIQEG